MANINTSRLKTNSSYETSPDIVHSSDQLYSLTPELGAQVFDTTTNQLKAWDGTDWVPFLTRKATGWGLYGNSALTVGSPQVISEGEEDIIILNERLIETNLPADIDTFLDITTYKITPKHLNDVFNFNFSLTAKSNKNNGIADFRIYSNGTLFRSERMNFTKGTLTDQGFNFTSTQHISEVINANGFTLHIAAIEGDISIHSIKNIVTRIYKSL